MAISLKTLKKLVDDEMDCETILAMMAEDGVKPTDRSEDETDAIEVAKSLMEKAREQASDASDEDAMWENLAAALVAIGRSSPEGPV